MNRCMVFSIYRATNILNKKCYIGWTAKTLEQRIKDHLSTAFHRKKKYPFHYAILKYGKESFHWEILFRSNDPLFIREHAEKFCIELYQSHVTKNGYNATFGGDGVMQGRKHTEKSKKKIGDWGRGKVSSMKGRRHSAETCAKMSVSHTGSHRTNETRLRQSVAAKLRWSKVNG